jgi:hypothetical protein
LNITRYRIHNRRIAVRRRDNTNLAPPPAERQAPGLSLNRSPSGPRDAQSNALLNAAETIPSYVRQKRTISQMQISACLLSGICIDFEEERIVLISCVESFEANNDLHELGRKQKRL